MNAVLAVGVPIVPDESPAVHFVRYGVHNVPVGKGICATSGESENVAVLPGHRVDPLPVLVEILKKGVNGAVNFAVLVAPAMYPDGVTLLVNPQKAAVGVFAAGTNYEEGRLNFFFRENIEYIVGHGGGSVVKSDIDRLFRLAFFAARNGFRRVKLRVGVGGRRS